MKKRWLSTLALLLLAVVLVSVPNVQAEPGAVYIPIGYGPTEYTVQQGETVILYSRWGACSPGLVRMYTIASNFELTLDGEPLLGPEQVDELWGEPGGPGTCELCRPEPCGPGPCEYCVGNQSLWWAYWYYPLDITGPGTYELFTTITLDHQLHDGGDWDDDRVPDFLDAGQLGSWLKTITVE